MISTEVKIVWIVLVAVELRSKSLARLTSYKSIFESELVSWIFFTNLDGKLIHNIFSCHLVVNHVLKLSFIVSTTIL